MGVALRLVSWDGPSYFTLRSVPQHDMSQDLAFFATNMHSLRAFGSLVWWNPIVSNGYAQYYQAFLSPLAPTENHIVFIVWAEVIRFLALFGIAIPEYYQYLTVTYIVLPFLAFTAFCAFLTLLFKRRAVILIAMLPFVLSGIGLWNGAWFYFQEPFSLFFLLWAALSLLQRPSVRRAAMLGVALLVQLVSVNYWTEYNSFFIVFVLAAYAGTHREEARALVRWVREETPTRSALLWTVVGLSVLTLALWGVLILSIVYEQVQHYARSVGLYDINTAWRRVQEIRRFTTELFNPNVDRALKSYFLINPQHNARYIGAFFLPFLALLPFYPWGRRERFLVALGALVLMMCLAPAFLLQLWAVTPLMNRIEHEFYFYSQYWQLVVVLLAAAGLERVIENRSGLVRARFRAVTIGVLALAGGVLLIDNAFSQLYPTNNPGLQTNLLITVIAGAAGVLLLQFLLYRRPANRRLLLVGLTILAVTDLSRYFWQVNRYDQAFTATRFGLVYPLAPSIQHALARPWTVPASTNGFTANLYPNMPITNDFWLSNDYMVDPRLMTLQSAPASLQDAAESTAAVGFMPYGVVVPDQSSLSTYIRANSPNLQSTVLLAQLPNVTGTVRVTEADGTANVVAQGTVAGTPRTFSTTWRHWAYNDDTFTVTTPRAGWLVLRQLYDPLWRITVDGRSVQPVQADLAAMAVPVGPGRHDVVMSYWPLARTLYVPAAIIFQIALLLLLWIAAGGRRIHLGRPGVR